MIVLRFGMSGRLARICETAVQLAAPKAISYIAQRTGDFSADSTTKLTIEALLANHLNESVLWLDASIDHSSTENLIAHEAFKRQTLNLLAQRGRLYRAVGISSGITLIDPLAIKASASHMLEYRRQKLLQEQQFASLECPSLLPQLFTLIGPITYSGQSAAWAQILRARVARTSNVSLNEPYARKAWATEFQVFQAVLDFLSAPAPNSRCAPLVSGNFTLAQIAATDILPLPPLKWSQGVAGGWLVGDYLPHSARMDAPTPLRDALLHALCLELRHE